MDEETWVVLVMASVVAWTARVEPLAAHQAKRVLEKTAVVERATAIAAAATAAAAMAAEMADVGKPAGVQAAAGV